MSRPGKFNLYAISEARNVIFGLATLWIGLFHSGKLDMANYTGNKILINAFRALRITGNVGVDMFLFLSGVGLFFSFSKDGRILNFWKKRLMRVLPSAFLIVCIIVSFRYVYGKYTGGLLSYISRLSFTYFFIKGERVFWFISLILLLYLLFPLLYKIIDRFRWKGMLSLLVLVVGFNYALSVLAPGVYMNNEVALCRIPVFIVGIWMAKFIKEKREISIHWMWVFLTASVALLIFIYYSDGIEKTIFPGYTKSTARMYNWLDRYAACPAAVSLTALISWVCTSLRRRGKCNLLRNFFEFVGMYSMEYYLIYLNLSRYFIDIFDVSKKHVVMAYFGSFVVSLALCVTARKLCDFFMDHMTRKPKKPAAAVAVKGDAPAEKTRS